MVEGQPRLGKRKDHEEQQRQRGDEQHERAGDLSRPATRQLVPDPGVHQAPPAVSSGGGPADFGRAVASWANKMSRSRAEYFGWHVVNVNNRCVGRSPKWLGTG